MNTMIEAKRVRGEREAEAAALRRLVPCDVRDPAARAAYEEALATWLRLTPVEREVRGFAASVGAAMATAF